MSERVPDDYIPPATELDATAETLAGRRITRVDYHGLSSSSPERVSWDFDTWHCPVMGAELLLDDGTPYSAVWDSVFGHFSLHLYAASMNEQLVTAQGEEPNRWSVHDHPRWARLLTDPVTDSRLLWQPDLTDTGATAPAALRLTFPQGSAWIIAATEQSDGSWWLGADEVVVSFTEDMTTRIGLVESR
jgi:hypothetical protein